MKNENLSKDAMAARIKIDTDELDKKNIPYTIHPNHNIFIPTKEGLAIDDIGAVIEDTEFPKEEDSSSALEDYMASR